MLPIANTNVANWKLGIGIGNNGNISLRFVQPAKQAFSCCPKGLFVSAERSCPKGGGQAARGGRPAVQAGAPRRTPITARRSTATAAFVVARKRTMRTRRPLSQVLDRRSLGEGGCGCVARRARQKFSCQRSKPRRVGTCRKIEHPCLPVRQHVPSIIVGKRRGAFGNYERPEPPK